MLSKIKYLAVAAEYEMDCVVRNWFSRLAATTQLSSTNATMRALTLLPLLYIHSALAAPSSDGQIVLGEAAALVDALREGFLPKAENDVANVINNAEHEDKAETWEEKGKEFVKQNGLVCAYFCSSRVSSTQLAQS